VWSALTGQRRVTAMGRRGRGSSGDAGNYELSREYADVSAVAAARSPGARRRRPGWRRPLGPAARAPTPRHGQPALG